MKQMQMIFLMLFSLGIWAQNPGYYRYPDLAGDQLVFTAEGDLWVMNLNETRAQRLTTHPAEETQACFSPDGSQIAFVANYEGAPEIYLINATGGVPTRISYENSRVSLQGWTPEGKLLYGTNTQAGMPDIWALRMVDPKSLQTETIPLADASQGMVAPNGDLLVFTQFGLHMSSDSARVYRGGGEGEIWTYLLGSDKEAQLLTGNHTGDARLPMVTNDKIYFISDASGSDQIWSMAYDGQQLEQVTKNSQWPILYARLNQGRIVFQQGGDLKILDLQTGESHPVEIHLTSDFPHLRARWIQEPLKFMTSTRLGGDPLKVAITARGQVALAVTDGSRLVQVHTPETSRTREAILSPEGDWVYAINDANGANEIWRFASDGSRNAEALTQDSKAFLWNLYLSPDGKSMAYDNKKGELWLLNIAEKKSRLLLSGNDSVSPYTDVVWSKDSKLLAVTCNRLKDERSRLILLDPATHKQLILTSDKYQSYSPAFSSDGQWLYFLSDRHFNPNPSGPWGDRNMGVMFDKQTQVFAYALVPDARFPFEKPNELLADQDKSKSKEAVTKNDKKDKKSTPETMAVDWDGVSSRLWQVPIRSGNFSNLAANESHLYFLEREGAARSGANLQVVKMGDAPKVDTFGSGISGFELSTDGKSMLVRKGSGGSTSIFIVKAGEKFPKDTKDAKVSTGDWKLRIDPRQEWAQMFHDAWLMHAAFLYDPAMRGLDWEALREKFKPLLMRITDRYELNDVLRQMMGELNALHSQVRTGDVPTDPEAPGVGLLGCRLEQTKNGVTISHVFAGDPERPEDLGPLSKPGVDARKGDLIEAVNGQKTPDLASLNSQLLNETGKQVLLTLRRDKATVKTIVVPGSPRTDFTWRYQDWVYGNLQKVQELSPEIGYLHLRAMGAGDLANFAREFYAQIKKQGLIIDVRRNWGGNVDSLIIEKLMRKAWEFWQAPNSTISTNMQQAFRGHLVVLADQFTYSDGETFTAGFKALQLGKVIGKRTAGAGVWLRGMNSLVDRGMVRVAEFPQYAVDGHWIVEGYGVEPDLEVDNLPHATFKGQDAQLEAAIKYLNEKIAAEPVLPLKGQPIPEGDIPAKDVLKK